MKLRLTNTWKHFAYMLAVGLAVWEFAYFGNAQGLGWFPTVDAFIITIWVEHWQWSRSGKPVMTLLKERGFDTLVDVLAGNAGFFLGYNVLLILTTGGWVV